MAGISTSSAPRRVLPSPAAVPSYFGPLLTVTMLFFTWGFIVSMNDVLIPKLKVVFTLQHWQAMLVQTAFFGAYFIVSLAYFLLSMTKGDPIQRIGYKTGIIIGLLVCAAGAGLFYPSAEFKSYGLFLAALFVLASGTTILQIAANPYVTILGAPETSSSRLNLTQAFNSLGTTLAPVVGGYLVFDHLAQQAGTGADSVKLPYLGLAAATVLLALLIRLAPLPAVGSAGRVVAEAGALRYRHLVLGVVCIFAYVGGEVSIGSNFISLLKLPQIGGFPESEAKYYLTFFWGGAMIGRFFGAVALAQFRNNAYKFGILALIILVTYAGVASVYDQQQSLIVLGLMLGNVLVLLLSRFVPQRTLAFFAACVVGLLLLIATQTGAVALWAIVGIGLFNSIMFPTIFDLAIKGLGQYTSQASSLLVMACVGGAVVPPLQGLLADETGNLQASFLLPVLCYLYVMYYGIWGYKSDNQANDTVVEPGA
ncbi:sugar MFS transporter [Hymenobacter monticola]|uniref:Sugar MFS transporter n=1 Tax=Hymenobacter monticola TaxID=1705399 RepID=A0ABY4BDK4_9BACT|nr:sugar MFS transporter [Hymenobacter monticola]UOE36392.1 sugar MFS transporter [Hymenobacter monticola]